MGKQKRDTTTGTLRVDMKNTVKKKAKTKKESVRLVHDVSGAIRIEGRPAWPTKAKKIKVNQIPSQGEVEDRRHLLHWDEQLKPLLDRVFTALHRECPLTLVDELKAPMARRGYTRLPAEADKLMERVAAEINGAQTNLIADRADINKAIEHVREYLRQYQHALQVDEAYATEMTDGYDGAPNADRMKRYKGLARKYLPADRTDTPIVSRITEINTMLLELIDGCESPAGLWVLLNNLTYSVTFDLSGKAVREKTAAALTWQRKMQNNFGESGKQQYEDLLTLLD